MPKRLEKTDRKPTEPPRKPRRWGRRFFVILILCGLFGVYVSSRLMQLEKVVQEKFSAEKRWNIPSRVYSDAEYIVHGYDPVKRGLVGKLERLGYRRVNKLKGPGDFVVTPETIDIHLHDFTYPQEKFAGFAVRLERDKEKIIKVVDLESMEELAFVRLEPEPIATLFDEKMEDRTLITLKDCPPHLLEAVLLIEDERYFKHRGVDPIAIGRAMVADLLALRIVQGGSTITQQLVKNYFLTSKKSFSRKFDEILMALILETKYTKGQILEAYLNEIYFGQKGPTSVTGVAEAAKFYFSKDLHQITVGEAALLAGMIRSPHEYSPIYRKDKAKQRRDFILKRMLEADIITQPQYQEGLREEIVAPKIFAKPVVTPYFIDFVKSQLGEFYPEEVLETEGLRIFTTLDMTMQLAAQEALIQGLNRDKLQGCIVAISPQNGYVRALVGGRDYLESQFNRCTQAQRQPGSTFKPFVYLTALDPSRSEKIFTPASLIEDTTFSIETPEGPWSPQNYDKQEHGLISLRTALEKSYNIASAKLGMAAGLRGIVKTAQDAGITSALAPYPAIALGIFEVTPLELASAYTIFPNLGMRTQPVAIMNVMKPDGEVLEKKVLKTRRVFDEKPVALVNSLMAGVIERGTGQGAKNYGFGKNAAGKTGTSSDYKDAWFVGFTPNLLGLVWVGFDDNTPVELSGAQAALPIWGTFMRSAVGAPIEEFPFPEGLVRVSIDPTTGKVATRQCPEKFEELFILGTEPTEECPHRSGKVLPTDQAGPKDF